MPFGVTDEGFVIKPLENIKSDIEADQLGTMNPALDQTAQGPIGQLNGIFSAKLREIWELQEATYNAFNPDSANGASLDNAVALCPGISRNPATPSEVVCECNLEDGTYAIGELVANVVGNAEARFVNTQAIVVTTGPADFDLTFESEEPGEVVALAGTLTVISEPVTGWNSVTNVADAEVGDEIETDAELRQRREEVIRFSGSTNVEAIKADLILLDGMESVVVEENEQDIAVDGLVPHSIRAIIWDGTVPSVDDADIASTIFLSKAAGIDTNGIVSEVVTDSMGKTHTILFDRATEQTLEIQLTAVTDDPPSNWADADGPLVTALLDFVADEMNVGDDAIYLKLVGVATDFEWLVDFTLFEIKFTGGAFGTSNLTTASDEKVTLDSGDVTFV